MLIQFLRNAILIDHILFLFSCQLLEKCLDLEIGKGHKFNIQGRTFL